MATSKTGTAQDVATAMLRCGPIDHLELITLLCNLAALVKRPGGALTKKCETITVESLDDLADLIDDDLAQQQAEQSWLNNEVTK